MFDASGRFLSDVDMYNVLLIDDEKSVRESIKASVDWNRLNIAMVQEAENGIEGLQQMFECVPDLVFLDIQMPRMDGIEFASIIRRRFPQIRIVIISGYDRFEYAQRALRVGVNDYVLKPFLNERILEIIEKQLAELRRENAGANAEPAEPSIGQMRTNLANRFLQGNPVTPREKNDYFGEFTGLHGTACYFMYWGGRSSQPPSALQLDMSYDFAISNLAENVLSAKQCGFAFETYNNELAAVFFGTHAQLCQIIDIIRIQFSKMTDSSAFIAVSGCGCLEALPALREQALEAERKCFLGVEPMIVFYDDIEKQPSPFEYPSKLERKMLSKCFHASAKELAPEMDAFFSRIRKSNLDSQSCKYILIRLLTKLSNCIDNFNNLSVSKEMYGNFDPVDMVQGFASIHEAQQWLARLFDDAYAFYHKTDNACPETFRQIRDYIHEYYSDESLNLKKCSDDLFLSYSYITRVLKREVGRTFTEYLTEYRIQKSKELLSHSLLPMSKVSEMVGFTHASYFSTVFKKYEKLTPQQFRQQASA